MNLDILLKHCIPGLFALINTQDKKIDIRYTSNISNAVIRILTDIQNNNFKYKDLETDIKNGKIEFVFLETCKPLRIQLLRVADYIDSYKSKGYTLYRNIDGLRYKLRRDVHDGIWYLSLVDRNNNAVVVGLFENKDELEEFVGKNYSNKPYYPIYSKNNLSITYFHKQEALMDIDIDR